MASKTKEICKFYNIHIPHLHKLWRWPQQKQSQPNDFWPNVNNNTPSTHCHSLTHERTWSSLALSLRNSFLFFFLYPIILELNLQFRELHLLHLCLPRGCSIYIFIRLARLSTAGATVVVLALLRFLQADTAASDTRVSEPLNFKK